MKKSKTNENGYTTCQNIWNAAKTVPRGKFKLIKSYLKNFFKVLIKQHSLLATRIRKQNKVQSYVGYLVSALISKGIIQKILSVSHY